MTLEISIKMNNQIVSTINLVNYQFMEKYENRYDSQFENYREINQEE